MAKEESLKVAVRVRPFNNRELQRKSKCVVEMMGPTTYLTNPDDPEDVKNFVYDFSYWSFDGCKERSDGYFEADPSHPNSIMYADQMRVYTDLGKGMLDNAWKGYNATLFAYGQTGSGKSWSVIGYGPNKGIVPLICEDIFTGIDEKKGGKTQFEVQFSMLEIYNEVVRDLLQPKQDKGGLKIRECPERGFYAEGLKTTLVESYDQLNQKMQEGTVNRTIASTNMNARSSRAHTIVGIKFIQKSINAANVETAKTAVINLVDLAGSERVEATGATGEQLKEGAAIKLSLTKLGDCIHALEEKSNGKSRVRIPFRSCSLTKLLMNALVGNSKTVMVAVISPADINYDETMSTLRFADRAKQIKTKALVNEDPVEKLISDLREENERLKKSKASGKMNPADFVDEDGDGIHDKDLEKMRAKWEEEMKARRLENDKEILEMKKSYVEKLKAQKKDTSDSGFKKKEEDRQKKPHIYNLNMDPQLSGKVFHILKPGPTTIGNRKGNPSDITMVGPGIQEQHAVINVTQKNEVNFKPATSDCRILVNGTLLQGEATLSHNDRLLIGSTQLWVFQHPAKKSKPQKGIKLPEITYEYALEEIAVKSGINVSGDTDLGALQEELLRVIPEVEEANSISEELDKRVKFEIMLIAPEVMDSRSKGKSQIHVKMKNLENGTELVWPQEKFRDRFYLLKEMFEHYEDEDEREKPECNDSELTTIGCEETTNSSMNSSAESTPWPTSSSSASTPVPTERPSKRPKNKQALVFDLIAELFQAKKDTNINRYDLQAKTWAQELKEVPTDTATEAIRLINEVMYLAKKGNINEHTRVQQQNYVPISSYQVEIPKQNTYSKQMNASRPETSKAEPTYASLTNFQQEAVPEHNLETHFANFTGDTYEENE